ncbi:tetratricopeptide repeat protein [Qipengyuania sp. ASV99]|uniref:tetratricopeptide repeat protein n=1 Tax=Qipengyuania sp. ASV99 TaxID=3399681 RepID=UPI003A4C54C1
MPGSQGTKFDFNDQLRLETNSVLSDLVFKRSPVQSKLLKYLAEATVRDGAAPSQFEIAVDALGKDPDFDLANDSYPRVQISRLRANLENYYARNRPQNGLRLVLEPGQYRLALIEETEPAASKIAKRGSQIGGSEDLPETSHPAGLSPSQSSTHNDARWWLAAAIGVAILAIATIPVLLGWSEQSSTSAPAELLVPSVELRANIGPSAVSDQQFAGQIEMAVGQAEIQLANSFVSRMKMENSAGEADYILELDFMRSGSGDQLANFRLMTNSGKTLYSDRVEFDPDNPVAFDSEINSALVYITSPTGAIAKDQLRLVDDFAQSGYGCFLQIENGRANVQRTSQLVDKCIAEYPDSDYATYMFSRRAFAYFRDRRIAGEPIERSGNGWSDLNHALQQDPYNAFANFLAAKIELANNDCAAARSHIERAFEKGNSYPAMMAALEAETNSCPAFRNGKTQAESNLRTIIADNPSPDALLHLNLLIAAVSMGDLESARLLAGRAQSNGAPGKEQETIRLLTMALIDPAMPPASRQALRAHISIFIWSDAGVDRIMQNLS